MHISRFTSTLTILLLLLLLLSFFQTSAPLAVLSGAAAATGGIEPAGKAQVLDDAYLYLPVLNGLPAWPSPFGVEPTTLMLDGLLYYTRLLELQPGWVRLGNRVSWSLLQPNEGDPIQWDLLADFEQELRNLKAAGIKPLVTFTVSPVWARVDPNKSCSAVRADKFYAFASFVEQIVARYSQPEFEVRNWEFGNEPDVDPDLVQPDSPFGCWGDLDDPYYGGRHYGEMLKVIAPRVRGIDRRARIWIGGLLLDKPNSNVNPYCIQPGKCRPELFLEGILLADAASSFDVVAYHAYPYYLGSRVDPENGNQTNAWYPWGGVFVGKARFLRQIMQTYGVDKPLVINETSLTCPNEWFSYCNPPDDNFYQMQADFIVRSYTRSLAENISGFYWYTLEGPGWRYTGLLNRGSPTPVYLAYRQLIERLDSTRFLAPVDYAPEVEAYAFDGRTFKTQVVWARMDQTLDILVPAEKFLAAYDRGGTEITPLPAGENYQFSVNFSPIYLVFSP